MRKTLRRLSLLVAVAGVCGGTALTGAGLAAAAPASGNGTEANLLYSVNGGATWSDSVTAQRGQQVLARLFYDTTKDTNVTDASLTTQIPDGFTYVPGSTHNVLAPQANPATGAVGPESKSAAVADSVWSGGNLTVSPSAGFNSESDASQSGVLRTGVTRYLNLQQCQYNLDPGNPADTTDRLTNFVPTPNGLRSAHTNTSNTADTALNCDGININTNQSNFAALDLLGNRYFNLDQCQYDNPDVPAGQFDRTTSIIPAPNSIRSAKSNTSNTPATSATCTPGNINPNQTDVLPLDLLSGRYINLHQCQYQNPTDDLDRITTIEATPNGIHSTGTNVSNTADTTLVCAGGTDSNVNTGQSAVLALDTLDTTRGAGYIQFAFTSTAPTPACGQTVTRAAVSSTEAGTLNGTGTGTPASSAGMTLAAFSATGDPCPTVLQANDDQATTASDSPVNVDVLGNDDVPSGDTATVTGPTSGPAHGSVVLNPNGTFTYTPDAGYVGTDSFSYTISDTDGNSAVGTVTMTVTAGSGDTPLVAPAAIVPFALLGFGFVALRRRRRGASS